MGLLRRNRKCDEYVGDDVIHGALIYPFKGYRCCDFIDSLFHVPVYCNDFGDSPGKDTLSGLRKLHVPPTTRTAFVKLQTSALLVKMRFRDMDIFVLWSPNSCFCDQPEKSEPYFIWCYGITYNHFV